MQNTTHGMESFGVQNVAREAALEVQRLEEVNRQERKERQELEKKKVEDDQYKRDDKVRRSLMPKPLSVEEKRLLRMRTQYKSCGIPPGF